LLSNGVGAIIKDVHSSGGVSQKNVKNVQLEGTHPDSTLR
jgi:hypothetical protein